ncbi:MAG: hypothetical protein K940chlam2_01255 [Chlamydiae bacterium]|nr:hypothetical protein [Chlamydiota bacterium]
MTAPSAPEDIPLTTSTSPIKPGETKIPMGEKSFQAYMQGAETNPLTQTGTAGTSQVSPFDLAGGKTAAAGPTFDTMMAQAKTAHMGLGELSQQLQTPKLKLKQSSKYILKNKLAAAGAHIRSASQKMGAQTLDQKVPAGMAPLGRFIGMITHGQNQLQEAQEQLSGLKDKGQNLAPADMLQIQIKLNTAQQDIEYSSILLSKSVDDIKMMMNIQL